ncbi:tRNA dihydrouridine synthase DusB, partial [Dysgonomonas sp. OttesenSCG-928-D17]|nr:tRNA dihydrouridine synthase DusB [Dysgonomonas sp. OttesenSCG-928-D17]
DMINKNVAHSGERGGIIHSRRHLAASSLFKGIPDFKKTRVAMLRAESIEELFDIMDSIPEQFEVN